MHRAEATFRGHGCQDSKSEGAGSISDAQAHDITSENEVRGVDAVSHVGSHGGSALEVVASETEAFTEIYERHLSRVYSYMRSRTQTDEDAADLTQQTFVQALHAFPRYDERGVPVEVWLFRIARNLVVAAHRRRGRDGAGQSAIDLDLLPEALQPLAKGAEEPESVILRKEALARLRDLFARLDADKRELLVLRFVSHLTAKEIALVVGKSEAAVQKQLRRTLHGMKEQYDED